MYKKLFTVFWISSILCLLPTSFLLVHRSILPENLPIHWDAYGRIDGSASKFTVFLIMPLLYLMLNIALHLLIHHFPETMSVRSTPEIIRKYGKWLAPTISILQCSLSIMHVLVKNQEWSYHSYYTWIGLAAIISADYTLNNNWYERFLNSIFDMSQVSVSYFKLNMQLHKTWTIAGMLLIICSYLMINVIAMIVLIGIALTPILLVWYTMHRSRQDSLN